MWSLIMHAMYDTTWLATLHYCICSWSWTNRKWSLSCLLMSFNKQNKHLPWRYMLDVLKHESIMMDRLTRTDHSIYPKYVWYNEMYPYRFTGWCSMFVCSCYRSTFNSIIIIFKIIPIVRNPSRSNFPLKLPSKISQNPTKTLPFLAPIQSAPQFTYLAQPLYVEPTYSYRTDNSNRMKLSVRGKLWSIV